jgi:U3 small nucleolar RNA-associated protein 10
LSNPTLHTVIHAATHNQPFFSAFNQYVLGVAKARHHSSQHHPSQLLSFWASVVTQAVDGMVSAAQSGRETVQKQRQEALMLRVLPVLNEALLLRDVPELVFGCCTITIVLAANAHLEDHVLDGMMEALASGWTSQTTEARITCLAIIAQNRTSSELAKGVIKRLGALDDFSNRMLSVAENHNVDRLALGYILGTFKRMLKSEKDSGNVALEAVEKFVRAELFGAAEIRLVIKSLLSTAKKLQKSGGLSHDQRSSFANLVTLFAESPTSSDLFQRALAKSSFTQDELELSLQTVIPLRLEATPTDVGDAMQEVETTINRSRFDTDLSTLAEREPRALSFLTFEMSEEFGVFYSVFLQALSSEQNLQRFTQIPALGQEFPLAFVSFYVRVWAGKHPQVARCAAIRLLAATLNNAEKNDLDFQGIIPYLIVALMDKSINVRRAAAECTEALAKYYKSIPSDRKEPLRPILLDNKPIRELSAKDSDSAFKDAKDLVQKILRPDLEECIIDANNVSIILVNALDGSSNAQKSSIKVGGLDLKSSRRASIFAFLANHAVGTPLLSVRLHLLSILSQVGKSSSVARTQLLIPALRRWLVLTPEELSTSCDSGLISPSEVDLDFFRVISAREKDGVHLLRQIFAGEHAVVRAEIFKAAHQRLQEIWPGIKQGECEPIALALLQAALSTEDSVPEVQRELAMETLRSLPLSTEVLVALVERLPNALQMPDKPPAAKRRRTSRNEMARFVTVDTVELSQALRRYTLVLELVENSKPEDHPELLKGLFHVLGEIHDYRTQTDSGMVYLQGLAINSLLAIVDKLKVCVSRYYLFFLWLTYLGHKQC